jgi:hypothetical protein
MVNVYSVCGFVGGFIVTAACSSFLKGPATGIGVLKILLRRLIFEAALISLPTVGLIALNGSERAWNVWFGVVAYVGVMWAWSLAAFAFVGLHWVFTNGVGQNAVIRRTPEGVWQSRPTYRHWKRQVAEAQGALEKNDLGAFFDEETFERLVGFTWKQYLNRMNEPLPEGDHRPWQNITDEYSPSIETAYQRYVHQG